VAHLARTRVHRSLAATLIGLALLVFMSACGMKAQTTQPYTPAEGVNTNIGPTGEWVQVRNLMVLSRGNGEGFLSASIVADQSDTLTGVTGHPIKTSGDPGAEFTATLAKPLELTPGKLVVLTDEAELITVQSSDLMVGGEAEAKEDGVPGFEDALDAFGPDADGVEDEREGDDHDGWGEHDFS